MLAIGEFRSTDGASSWRLRRNAPSPPHPAAVRRGYSRARASRAPSTSARSFANATSRGRYFIPQSGPTCRRSAGITVSAASIRSATSSGVSTGVVGEVEHADDDGLAGDRLAAPTRSSFGCAASIARMSRGAAGELVEERVAGRPVVHDVGVAEAGVQRGRARDAGERAIDRRQRELARLLGPRLQPRLVDLHDVGARREQVATSSLTAAASPSPARPRRRRTRSTTAGSS